QLELRIHVVAGGAKRRKQVGERHRAANRDVTLPEALQRGQIDYRRRFAERAQVGVVRHADDGAPLGATNDVTRFGPGNMNAFPERILPWPQSARGGFADDRDERRGRAIVVSERAAAVDVNTKGPEELGAAHLRWNHRKPRAVRIGLPLNAEPDEPDAVAEHGRHDNLRGGDDAGN